MRLLKDIYAIIIVIPIMLVTCIVYLVDKIDKLAILSFLMVYGSMFLLLLWVALRSKSIN